MARPLNQKYGFKHNNNNNNNNMGVTNSLGSFACSCILIHKIEPR